MARACCCHRRVITCGVERWCLRVPDLRHTVAAATLPSFSTPLRLSVGRRPRRRRPISSGVRTPAEPGTPQASPPRAARTGQGRHVGIGNPSPGRTVVQWSTGSSTTTSAMSRGDRRAHAGVDALAEGEDLVVGAEGAEQVERLGPGKDALVMVGRAHEDHDPEVGGDGDSCDGDLVGGLAVGVVQPSRRAGTSPPSARAWLLSVLLPDRRRAREALWPGPGTPAAPR